MESWWSDPDARLNARQAAPAPASSAPQQAGWVAGVASQPQRDPRRELPDRGAREERPSLRDQVRTAPGAAAARRTRVADRVLPYETDRFESKYELGRKLGEGAFGVVYVAKSKKSSREFACKTISKTKLIRPQDRADVVREVEILQRVKGHPNIVSIRHVFEDDTSVSIVMDMCAGGELFDLITKRGTFTEQDAAATVTVMLELCHHLHANSVVHRDLKPENFLLLSAVQETGSAGTSLQAIVPDMKVTDFGLSVILNSPKDCSLHQTVGTPFYVAPEVVNGAPYGAKCDVWSLGCIAYILLSGRPPFTGATVPEIISAVKQGHVDLVSKPWHKVSASGRDFVQQMLTYDPAHRPDCGSLLKHAWLRDASSSSYVLSKSAMNSLRGFWQTNNFKKAALLALARESSSSTISSMEKAFREMDTDRSGTVSIQEMRAWLEKRGKNVDHKALLEAVRAFDIDGNAELDYHEFLLATSRVQVLNRADVMLRAFQKYDLNHDGKLDATEIGIALEEIGVSRKEAKQYMREFDKDGSGTIEYEEFVSMLVENNEELEEASSYFKKFALV
ncbi:Calcium-dependent protein kinase 17 [Porphyridium purpureum]|uniref:Calcium-dependent protein kinase 17 n=1 Tax=Porphyridium purpureum TaxID=35688 RepID=A0A5J4Z187_PORPP|nr:Calcium-dependent protein kinase 17 [Porphyridium purpureum]|eukprot:POR0400..scf208_2